MSRILAPGLVWTGERFEGGQAVRVDAAGRLQEIFPREDADLGGTDPGDGDPGGADSGGADPGNVDPGGTHPGDSDSADGDLGDRDRGDIEPGDVDPGALDPRDVALRDLDVGDATLDRCPSGSTDPASGGFGGAGLRDAALAGGDSDRADPGSADSGDPEPVECLPDRALLPGFVSAHSHAFQIGLRGRGERYPEGAGSFWTWREAMYRLVDEMGDERLYELSRRCFEEMLAAGITTVGEFHYLHHLGEGRDFRGDRVVLDAAADAGIRIVLLVVYYETGGIGEPLAGGQRRFATPDPAELWEHVDALGAVVDGEDQRIGVAAHSVRAVPLDRLQELWDEARRRDLPFHIHLEEQRREIEDCLEAYGHRPMELILDLGDDLQGLTAVHCTHTLPEDLRRFAEAGGRVCLCPLTEADLGDGIPALAEVPEIHDRLCLGTDSNHRIDMLEEIRWLEYGQRLRFEGRGVLRDEHGEITPPWRAALGNGAESLGLARDEGPLQSLPLDELATSMVSAPLEAVP